MHITIIRRKTQVPCVCGHSHQPTDKFCDQIGVPLMFVYELLIWDNVCYTSGELIEQVEIIICLECGNASVTGNDLFCENCGAFGSAIQKHTPHFLGDGLTQVLIDTQKATRHLVLDE